ncbi:MAG: hypothetical protein ACLT98_16795 [Eggerthellaceae bacterium]
MRNCFDRWYGTTTMTVKHCRTAIIYLGTIVGFEISAPPCAMADERKTILAGSGSLAKAARSVDCAAATFAQADRARRELGIDDAAQARRIIAPTMEKAEKPPFRFLGLSLQSSCETRALARILFRRAILCC